MPRCLPLLAALLVACPAAGDDKNGPKTAKEWLDRGAECYGDRRWDDAVKAFTECLRLDPRNADAFDRRGSAQFMRGKFAESVADFDSAIKLEPGKANGHWRRGISLYYAGKYDEGKKQFVGYEKVDTKGEDVENAVWHLMCAAKKEGLEKARKNVLKISKDRRVPLMEIYELYKGTIKPEAVLAAANAGEVNEDERGRRLFYAHLYLGIYHDLTGEKKKAIEHLGLAAGKYRIGHYMGDVARVHLSVLASP
jgi:lipoprotein NlpI